MFDEFFGVPMHPFAVHAPIVLLPIVAVVAVAFMVRDDWRQRTGWIMPAAVCALAAMLLVARESGESAVEAQNVFGDITRHEELGNQTFVITLVWFVATVGLVVWDRRTAPAPSNDLSAASMGRTRDPVAVGISVVVALLALAALVWLIRTGHAGAESRWDIG